MSKSVAKSLRLDAELARRIDVARGDVSWSRWVTRAIEQRLESPGTVVQYQGDVKFERPPAVPVRGSAAHRPTCTCAVCKPPKS